MGRLSISRETLNALFARSGNRCTFPGCTHEMVTERNLFVGQICHLEAANPGGPRFNPESNDEARRSADNLLLLCYRHHKETDDAETFDAGYLRKIKLDHETQFAQNPFKVNEAFLYRLQADMDDYWASLEAENRDPHDMPELAVRIPSGNSGEGAFAQIWAALTRVAEVLDWLASADAALNEEAREFLLRLGYDLATYDAVPYYRNPFENRNWEMHALGANNSLTDLSVAIQELEVRFFEEYIKTHPTDAAAQRSLETAKSALKELAVSAGYAD